MPQKTPSLAALALAASLAASFVACDGGDKPTPITDVRERSTTAPAPSVGVRTDERLGMEWLYDVPPGWQLVENPIDAPGRIATFRLSSPKEAGSVAAASAECSLSTAGGDLAMNVSRWRSQLGLGAATPEQIAALPTRPFLGKDAPLVDLAGRYVPRPPATPIENARLLGLVAEFPQASLFAKIIGPAAVVEPERERFLAFAASVRSRTLDSIHAREAQAASTTAGTTPMKEKPREDSPSVSPPAPSASPHEPPVPHEPAMRDEPSPSKPATPAASSGAEGLRWTVPPGWESGPEKPMRIATFLVAGASGTEVSVSKFPGDAGGALSNLNRWRGLIGAKSLTEDDLASSPKIPMIGRQAYWIDLAGHLNDAMRHVDISDASQLGAIAIGDDFSVFVRITGPSSEVKGQREAFRAFVQSFEVAK